MQANPNGTATTFNLFEVLKSETYGLHREVEKHIPLLNEDLTLEGYERHLLQLLGFYEPLEQEFMSFIALNAVPIESTQRMRTAKLIADLLALGVTPEVIDRAPRCKTLKRVNSVAQLIGAMYVTEGSTLGAQVITPIIKQKLNLLDDQVSFYAGHGQKTGKMWMSFQITGRSLVAPRAIPEAVNAAESTFLSLIQWLN